MFRPELIETSIVGINAALLQAVSVAPWQSTGHRIAKCVLCDAGSNPCGDHFFFHPKFHYINIVLLLLFLLPIAGSKAVCIANYETVTKPNPPYAGLSKQAACSGAQRFCYISVHVQQNVTIIILGYSNTGVAIRHPLISITLLYTGPYH